MIGRMCSHSGCGDKVKSHLMPRIFLNPQSGPGAVQGEQEKKLRALFPACEITPMGRGVDLKKLAREDAVELAYIAAGGDGTVNAVAGAVAGTERAMGVLPLGTLNHFAQDLNVPLDLEAAAKVISDGETSWVDAAKVNGLVFVNNSSLGAYPAMVMDRERMKKSGRNKWSALVAASARAFVRFRHLHVEMMVDGHSRSCTTPFLFVGNNEYRLDGMRLGRREHLNGGVLSLYLAPGASRLGVLRMAIAAVFGRLKQTPEYEEILVQEFTVRVHGRRRIRVSLDGEVRRMPGPLQYRILPGALKVLVPRTPVAVR